ncbi:MAG: hypothetical protein WCK01_03235 [Candidatus Uhrbacteria bacterium]
MPVIEWFIHSSSEHGTTSVVLVNETAHVLRRSSSRYHLIIKGMSYQYCCQDGCQDGRCDTGASYHVRLLLERAKLAGATKVVVRMGQRNNYVGSIHGLPVYDVSEVEKIIADGIHIIP